jgi:adenylate kinase
MKMTDGSFVHVALMGAQGSGKGTQAARLTPRYGLVHLSTGELFRAAIASGSALGQEIKTIYDRGDLIPDDLTLRLVAQRLDELAAARRNGAVITGALFDGFPRTAAQAEGLDTLLAKRGERLAGVVEVAVPLEQLVVRLAGRRVCPKDGKVYHVEFDPPKHAGVCDLCGTALIQRDDDQPAAIKRRLDTYFGQTAPLVDYFREHGLLAEINGNQPVDRVTTAIEAALARFGVRPIATIGAAR